MGIYCRADERGRELLRKFDVVSVREESAVELCRKFFGVNASHG